MNLDHAYDSRSYVIIESCQKASDAQTLEGDFMIKQEKSHHGGGGDG